MLFIFHSPKLLFPDFKCFLRLRKANSPRTLCRPGLVDGTPLPHGRLFWLKDAPKDNARSAPEATAVLGQRGAGPRCTPHLLLSGGTPISLVGPEIQKAGASDPHT